MSSSDQIDQLGAEIDGRVGRAVRDLREEVRRRLDEGREDLLRHLDQITAGLPESFVSREDLAPLTEGAGAQGRAQAFADLAASLAALDRGRTQAEVLNALLAEAARYASRSALFLTRVEAAAVWGSHGWGESAPALAGVVVDYDDAWSRLAEGTGTVFLRSADCAPLCSRIESPLPYDGVLVPLVVRDRVAAALYADRADERAALAVDALQVLTCAAALLIESLPFRDRGSTPTLRRAGEEGPGLPLWDAAAEPAVETAAAVVEAVEAEAAPAAAEPAVAAPPAPPEEAPAAEPPEPVAAPAAVEEPPPEEAEPGGIGVEDLGAPAWGPEVGVSGETVALELPGPAAPASWELEDIGTGAEAPAAEPDLWGRREMPPEEPWPAEPAVEVPAEPAVEVPAEPAAAEPATELPGEPWRAEPIEEPPAEEPAAEPAPWAAEAPESATAELSRDTVLLDRSQLPWEPPAAAPPPPVPAPFPPPEPPAEAPTEATHPGAARDERAPAAEGAPGSSLVTPPAGIEGPGWAFSTTHVPLPAGDEARHEEARRLARLLVSEIRLYNEEQVEEGRRRRDVYQRLRDDIERSRQMYEDRIDDRVRESTDYFQQELVRILGAGDAGALGS